jgi:hypothetical protein
MKNLLLISTLLLLAVGSFAQSDSEVQGDEFKAVKGFIKRVQFKKQRYSGFEKLAKEKSQDLGVQIVVIRYPNWVGGVSVGYIKIEKKNSQPALIIEPEFRREKLRLKEKELEERKENRKERRLNREQRENRSIRED